MPLWQALIILFAISLIASWVLTPLVRKLCNVIGLVDHPDQTRKLHPKITPLGGGISVVLSSILAVMVAPAFSPAIADAFVQNKQFLIGVGIASILICALGVVDDFGLLRGRYKLIGQIAIVGILFLFDIKAEQLTLFGNEKWQLSTLIAYAFTMVWILGAINSLNLLDGMDGLLSTIGIIICVAFACISFLNVHAVTTVIAVVMAGALLGFLRYNFPPASIFLGDSGSMFIGMIIGVLAIQSSMKEIAAVSMAAPLALMTLPILDTTAAILRRKLTGRSIYDVDRGHLHHCLQRAGLSNKRVLMWVTLICSFTALGAFVSSWLKDGLTALVCAACVVVFLIAFRFFGYVEFELVHKKIAASTSSMMGRSRDLAVHLQGVGNWNELWNRMTAWASASQLSIIQLDLNAPSLHEGFHARWDSGPILREKELWQIAIPIRHGEQTIGRLSLEGQHHNLFGDTWIQVPEFVAQVEEMVRQIALRLADHSSTTHQPLGPVKELALS